MPDRTAVAFATLLLAGPGWAAQDDPCSAASSASDVRLSYGISSVEHVDSIAKRCRGGWRRGRYTSTVNVVAVRATGR